MTLFDFVLCLAIFNLVYVACFRLLQLHLQQACPEYWLEIGSPSGFDGASALSVVRVLYSARIRSEVKGNVWLSVLWAVRVMLPLGLAAVLGIVIWAWM